MQLLDRLRGHLGGLLVSNDFYGRIKRKGHTKIVTLTSERRLYVVNNRLGDLINVCSVAIVREDKRTDVINSPLSIVRIPSLQTFSSPLGHLSFPDASFSGRYPVATSISNSNDGEREIHTC